MVDETTSEEQPEEERSPAPNDGLRERARRAASNAKESMWALAEVLYDVKRDDRYLDWGHDTWNDYVETELSVGTRASNQLIAIHETYRNELHLSEDVLKTLDWTKARDMAKAVNKDNVDEMVDLAKSTTRKKLMEHVNDRLSDQDADPEDMPVGKAAVKYVTHKFELDQFETYEKAVEAAMKIAKTDIPSWGADLIFQWFLQQHHNRVAAIEDELKRIQKTYKVDVLAVDQSATDKNKTKMMTEFIKQMAKSIGMESILLFFPEDATADQIVDKVSNMVDKLVEERSGYGD